jgi:hypothetical protein
MLFNHSIPCKLVFIIKFPWWLVILLSFFISSCLLYVGMGNECSLPWGKTGSRKCCPIFLRAFFIRISCMVPANQLISVCRCCEKHRRIRCLLLAVFSEWGHFPLWTPHLVSRHVVCFSKYADDEPNSLPLFVFKLQISVSLLHIGRLNLRGGITAEIKLLI